MYGLLGEEGLKERGPTTDWMKCSVHGNCVPINQNCKLVLGTNLGLHIFYGCRKK